MTEMKIECPKCKSLIEVDKVLEQQVLARHMKLLDDKAQLDMLELKAERAKFAKEKTIQEAAIKRAREDYSDKLKADRAKQAELIRAEILKDVSMKLEYLEAQVVEKDKRLSAAEKAELELIKRKNDLEMREKAIELEMLRKLELEKKRIIEESTRMAEETHRFELSGKQKTIEELKKVIDELNRKVKDTSQQMQGEIAELEIESSLKAAYPGDEVIPVPKGVRGADVAIGVRNGSRKCGSIIIEAKRTKNWSPGWIEKLKQDQLEAKAEIAVIVTTAMPNGESRFIQRDGVWITDYSTFMALIAVLRCNLIEIARHQSMNENRAGKMHKVMKYITGNEFNRNVQSVMDTVTKLQADLVNEKNALEKQWARREKLIQSIASTIASVTGDIDGLLGTDSQPLQIAQ